MYVTIAPHRLPAGLLARGGEVACGSPWPCPSSAILADTSGLRQAFGAFSRLLPRLGKENLAFALMIGTGDHAVLLHFFDQARRAIVADLQAALDIGRRDLALARDNGN